MRPARMASLWLLSAVVGVGHLSAAAAEPDPLASVTTIEIDAGHPQRAVSPLLMGLNHRYGFDGYGSYNRTAGQVADRLVRNLDRAGVSWVRYPGGMTANTFHWRRAIGPDARRGCQVNGGDGRPLASRYGPDEHQRFVERIGGTSSVVVNFATGTPREAARWVRYMNDPRGTSRWARMRAANGHPAPYDVTWWEVGNELEVTGQEYWMGRGNGVWGVSPVNGSRYAFGGHSDFVDQPVGTRCDWRPGAALSSGRPHQTKHVKFPRVARGQSVDVDGTTWRQVRRLRAAGPAARVYTLRRDTGVIRFGDGMNGAIPPRGAKITISYRSGRHPGFVDFFRAMKKADPSIQVCSSYHDRSFVDAMGSTHPYDCVVAHPYAPYQTMPPQAAHDFVMAMSDFRASHVAEIQDYARDVSGRPISVPVTEYGIFPLSTQAGTDDQRAQDSTYLKSLDHAVFSASQIVHWADLGIPLAARHTMVDFDSQSSDGLNSPPGFSVFGHDPTYVPSATARAMQALSHVIHGRLLPMTMSGNAVAATGASPYPALQAVATLDRRGRLGVAVVNRHGTQDVTVQLDPGQGGRWESLTAWEVTGRSTTSFNTARDPDAVTVVSRRRALTNGPFTWTFPRNSVTALRLSRP